MPINPSRKTARLAGALYLLSAASAGVPLIYVPSALIVAGNPSATAGHILDHETAFRFCMASELLGAILFIFLVRALYRLLSDINKSQASLMVTLVLVSVPITFLNVLNELAAVALFHGVDFLSVVGQPQREALGMFFLDLHSGGVNLANICWGLWLFPFGWMVIQSRFIPRIFGYLLLLDGLALVAVSLTTLLLPAYADLVSGYATLPELGELWMMAWLLIKGVNISPRSDS